MTKDQTGKCMRLLVQAKRGDEGSHRALVEIVSKEYRGMIAQFYTNDPMMGREDIFQEFYWGIWRAVDKVDHRGDPIFHLAQRGQWAVKSVVAAVNRRRHGTAAKEGGVSVVSLDTPRDDQQPSWEPSEESYEERVCEVIELLHRRRDARRRVQLLYAARLRPSHINALNKIMEHNIDLTQLGARRQLAKALGVSGQRVSVIMKQIEAIVEMEGVAA